MEATLLSGEPNQFDRGPWRPPDLTDLLTGHELRDDPQFAPELSCAFLPAGRDHEADDR